jgi:pimeloyl-ACP methyl ester carboxylesterase
VTQPDLSFLEHDGRRLAYRLRAGASPTLVFFPGYASDMDGAKALALDGFAQRRGLSLLRFDYSGTGSSRGRFEDGTLALWLDEGLALIDELTEGPLLLIGSSMGGWVALHVALSRSDRVGGLVGIAAAPDFTEWGFTPEQAMNLDANGPLTKAFWESGQQLRLLDREIGIDCPVRLIHGEHDSDVPLDIAFRLMRRLRSADVQLQVIKGGGHRLSEPREINAILRSVASLLESTE